MFIRRKGAGTVAKSVAAKASGNGSGNNKAAVIGFSSKTPSSGESQPRTTPRLKSYGVTVCKGEPQRQINEFQVKSALRCPRQLALYADVPLSSPMKAIDDDADGEGPASGGTLETERVVSLGQQWGQLRLVPRGCERKTLLRFCGTRSSRIGGWRQDKVVRRWWLERAERTMDALCGHIANSPTDPFVLHNAVFACRHNANRSSSTNPSSNGAGEGGDVECWAMVDTLIYKPTSPTHPHGRKTSRGHSRKRNNNSGINRSTSPVEGTIKLVSYRGNTDLKPASTAPGRAQHKDIIVSFAYAKYVVSQALEQWQQSGSPISIAFEKDSTQHQQQQSADVLLSFKPSLFCHLQKYATGPFGAPVAECPSLFEGRGTLKTILSTGAASTPATATSLGGGNNVGGSGNSPLVALPSYYQRMKNLRKLFTLFQSHSEDEILKSLSATSSSSGGAGGATAAAAPYRYDDPLKLLDSTLNVLSQKELLLRQYDSIRCSSPSPAKSSSSSGGGGNGNGDSPAKLQSFDPSCLGEHCTVPHTCPFYTGGKCLPATSLMSVFNLPGVNLQKKKALWDRQVRTVPQFAKAPSVSSSPKAKVSATAQSYADTVVSITTALAKRTTPPSPSTPTSTPRSSSSSPGSKVRPSSQPLLLSPSILPLVYEKKVIDNWLAKVQYPLFFLDFEAAMFYIPPFGRARCHDPLPFQYSIDVFYHDVLTESPDHFECLYLGDQQDGYDPAQDPKPFILSNMMRDMRTAREKHHKEIVLPGQSTASAASQKKQKGKSPRRPPPWSSLYTAQSYGTLVAHNVSFEKRCIDHMKCDKILAKKYRKEIEDTFVYDDTLPLFKKAQLFPPNATGSFSLKKLLPELCPELSYSDLGAATATTNTANTGKSATAVTEGLEASDRYVQWCHGLYSDYSHEEMTQLRQNLLRYNALDTKAMWSMLRVLA